MGAFLQKESANRKYFVDFVSYLYWKCFVVNITSFIERFVWLADSFWRSAREHLISWRTNNLEK